MCPKSDAEDLCFGLFSQFLARSRRSARSGEEHLPVDPRAVHPDEGRPMNDDQLHNEMADVVRARLEEQKKHERRAANVVVGILSISAAAVLLSNIHGKKAIHFA